MGKIALATTALFILAAVASFGHGEEKIPAALNFKMKTLAGKEVDLAKYKGKVVLLVNTASECGLTPQYEQLQALHVSLSDKGLAVVGIPCNQFGSQEPGTAQEISTFCKENYGVTFDLLAKVDVNGDSACPLYKYLTSVETKPVGAGKIGWNFEKFVLDRNGNVVGRFAADTSPDDPVLLKLIETQLASQ
jgi:glutathione peroxidase